jgi:osmotically-inducible protein OsmY
MAITPIQDKTITRQVQGKIAGRGLGVPCRIVVDTVKGQVTLTGTVQYEQQRASAAQVTRGVAGVRNVIDRLTVKPPVKWKQPPPPTVPPAAKPH